MQQYITKSPAEVRPADNDSESKFGAFDVILSAPTKDRDGETLSPDDWKTPLPDHITFDADHGMSVASTVGSGKPFIDDDGNLRVTGEYSSIPRAQEVRTLVNEGHIRTTSVAYMTEKTTKDGKDTVTRELLNGAFVAIPANRDALVLASKSGARNNSDDAKGIQSIHDTATQLGANCSGSGKSFSDVETKDGYQPQPYKADADETIKCPNCDKMNSPDARYCDQCGFKLVGNPDVQASKSADTDMTPDDEPDGSAAADESAADSKESAADKSAAADESEELLSRVRSLAINAQAYSD